jgi:ribosome maturation protein Sdo1
MKYKWPIRSINSQWPECKFFIMGLTDADDRVSEYLRNELGVSPARIVIYHLDYRVPTNKYKSALAVYSDRAILESEFVLYSTHDILWVPPYVPEGMTSRILRLRAEKEKKQPFVDRMPDY